MGWLIKAASSGSTVFANSAIVVFGHSKVKHYMGKHYFIIFALKH